MLLFITNPNRDYAMISSDGKESNSKIVFAACKYKANEDYGVIAGYATGATGIEKIGARDWKFEPCYVRLKFPKREYTETYQNSQKKKVPTTHDLLVNRYFSSFPEGSLLSGTLKVINDEVVEQELLEAPQLSSCSHIWIPSRTPPDKSYEKGIDSILDSIFAETGSGSRHQSKGNNLLEARLTFLEENHERIKAVAALYGQDLVVFLDFLLK